MKIHIDGELYESKLPIKIRYRPELGHPEFTTDPPTKEVRNLCERCGRFDLVEIVLWSKEELIERGWVVKA